MEQGKGNIVKSFEKEKNIKKKKPNKEQKIKINKTYNNEEKPYFRQTLNLHPNKQKYNSEKETLYFYYKK